MSTKPTQDFEEAYKRLVKGLTQLDFKDYYVPSELALVDDAFPLAINSQGQVLMAASTYGLGRIVVLGHEACLSEFPSLVENAVNWLRGDGSANLSVAVHQNIKAAADELCQYKFTVKVVGGFRSDLGVGVYVTDAYSVAADQKSLVTFMKSGGGILIGGQAWHWSSKNPGVEPLLNFDGNKVSGVAGIYFTEKFSEMETLSISPEVPYSWMSLKPARDFNDDLNFLLKGVKELDVGSTSIFSEILPHGSLAFPIVTTEDGRPFLAGAYYGLGRVLVISHEECLSNQNLSTFWSNAIRWLDQGRNGVVGIVEKRAVPVLSKSGFTCEYTKFRKDLSVYMGTAYSGAHAKEIQDFVAEGGGLVIGGHAWYWSYGGGNVMTEFPGNKILNKMGLSLLGDTIDGGIYKVPESSQAIVDNYHFRHMLSQFAGHVLEEKALSQHQIESFQKLSSHCAKFLQMRAYGCSSYMQVLLALYDIIVKAGVPQVSKSNPVKSPKDRLLLFMGSEMYKAFLDPDVLLPHLIKDIPTLPVVNSQRIKINVDTAGGFEWISTGLYLSPGMKTNLTLPAAIVNKGWKLQIGCQTDYLSHQQLIRAPSVHLRVPITSEKMQVQNLWGGLIYLLAPSQTRVTGVEMVVQQAVLAPYYKSGVTTADDWSQRRAALSPWAELEFDNIILTVPSKAVRDLEQVDELAQVWNNIMKTIVELAAKPLKFPRKERIVIDVQISHGWMHAGYPIMGQTATAYLITNTTKIAGGMWGPIHELGHNQQRSCWEFPPHTTECTCNLWSVYVHEELLGIKRTEAHSDLTSEKRKARMKKYVADGRKLSDWSVWTALETYLQLQEKFGWEAFKKVFAGYFEMSNFPHDNKGKMNLYAETFSRVVGMNLSGFFKSWAWPIEEITEEDLSHLPPWTDHPMAQYN
ncbi:TRPM8 channel-associated factor homolog [Takifugu rubripes]|uniref:TRPM8 channel-associated factor homolog n=1 Tax=Takifugu rubripes TaxID=31033 RepID=A0A674MJW7_TAKRU|nr:TRPM8 channel-associated factor homolog [Takifugu rubripes]